MKIEKMLIADLEGLQKVLKKSNRTIIKALKRSKENPMDEWFGCPLASLVIPKGEKQWLSRSRRKLDKLAQNEGHEEWASNWHFTFQPHGDKGGNEWEDLDAAARINVIDKVIKYFESKKE